MHLTVSNNLIHPIKAATSVSKDFHPQPPRTSGSLPVINLQLVIMHEAVEAQHGRHSETVIVSQL